MFSYLAILITYNEHLFITAQYLLLGFCKYQEIRTAVCLIRSFCNLTSWCENYEKYSHCACILYLSIPQHRTGVKLLSDLADLLRKFFVILAP